MKKLRNLLIVPLAALTASSIAACSVDTSEKLVVWTFTNEIKKLVKDYYVKDTGKKVEVVVKDSVDAVVNELMDIWDEGIDMPDVVALEAAVVKDIDTRPYLAPLDDIADTNQMYSYTKDVTRDDDGHLLGLSWQATPGGFFYKKRVADKLNISEAEMATYLSTWEGFVDLAVRCKESSVAVVSCITEPVKVFLSSREKSWVENNVLQLEPTMFGPTSEEANCFDVVRRLELDDYSHHTSERSKGWYADIDTDNCLGYFASCWGLNFDLMDRATTKSGWRMCKAPVDYFKGGTWLSIPKKAKHMDEAKDFIKYVTTNKTFLKKRCLQTGDFMNNKEVMNEIVQSYHCDFLDGQNHFELLVDVADRIDGNLISPYDAFIDKTYNSVLAKYAEHVKNMPKRDNYDSDEAYQEAYDAYIAGIRTSYKNEFRTSVKAKYRGIDTQSYQ